MRRRSSYRVSARGTGTPWAPTIGTKWTLASPMAARPHRGVAFSGLTTTNSGVGPWNAQSSRHAGPNRTLI